MIYNVKLPIDESIYVDYWKNEKINTSSSHSSINQFPIHFLNHMICVCLLLYELNN